MALSGLFKIWLVWAFVFLLMTLLQWRNWALFPLNLLSFFMNLSFAFYLLFFWEKGPKRIQDIYQEEAFLFFLLALMLHLVAVLISYRQEKLRQETLASCLRRD